MAGPWEKYQAASADGPWAKYAAPADPTALMQEHAGSLDYKMAVASGKPAETFPQYAARSAKEMALPAAGAMVGTIGGLPGQATGAMLGETANQALDITPSRSVIPEADKPDLTKVGIAGAAQLAVPAVAWAGKKLYGLGKSLVEPFYEKGREAIIGRALTRAAGGQDAQAIQAMRAAKELVPGSQPTVGQASQNAGLASLERAAGAISPESTVAFQGREAAQNAARVNAIQNVAGTDDVLSALQRHREAVTTPLRTKALNEAGANGIQSSLVMRRLNGLASQPGIRVNPTVKSALGEIKEQIAGATKDGVINPNDLYMIRKTAGKVVKKFAEDNKEFDERLTAGLVKDVQGYIDDAILDAGGLSWAPYLSKYQELSKPVNQMQVGQAIADKAIHDTGKVMPEKYFNALSDRTAQTATNFPQATLEGTMNPRQLDALNAVKADLVRAVQARNMAGTAGSDTVKKLAYSNLIDRAGVPTFLREFAPTQTAGNLLARGADSIYGRANTEIAEQLAQTMLNPQKAAQLMQRVGPSRFAPLFDALIRQGSPTGGAAVQHLYQEGRS